MTEISLDDFASYVSASPIIQQAELDGAILILCKDGSIFLQDTLGKIYQI